MADAPIKIGITCASESKMLMNVKPTTNVHKIIKAYCEAKGLTQESLRFLFDGDRIPSSATVQSLGLEAGDWYILRVLLTLVQRVTIVAKTHLTAQAPCLNDSLQY